MTLRRSIRSILLRRSPSTSALIAGLPPTPIGVWFPDTYVSSPRPTIPNLVTNNAANANILSAPNRLFNNTQFYQNSGLTVTDGSSVSTISGGATDWYLLVNVVSLPAGTYTYAIDVKHLSGNTSFRIGDNNAMATRTATSTTATYTANFTIASTQSVNLLIIRASGALAGSFEISNARLYAGSSDLGATPLVGNMVFGSVASAAQPTYTTGRIALGASSFGVIQLPSSVNLTAYTAVVLANRQSDTGILKTFLSKVQGYTQFSAVYSATLNDPSWFFNANQGSFNYGGLWQYANNRWNILSVRYDGTSFSIYLDEAKLITVTGAGLSASIADLFVGVFSNSSFRSGNDFGGICLYDRALSDAEMQDAIAVFKARGSSNGLTLSTARILCAEGDSITFGTVAGTSYAYLYGVNSNPITNGVVRALAGATLSVGGNSVTARAASVDATIPANKQGKLYIYTLMIGRNDGSGYATPASYASQVASFLQARKAAGWDRVVLCTCLPSTASGFNTWRNSLNDIYKGSGWIAANGIDALVDFTTVTTVSDDAAASNATYYSDGTHPSATAHALLEPVYRATLNAL